MKNIKPYILLIGTVLLLATFTAPKPSYGQIKQNEPVKTKTAQINFIENAYPVALKKAGVQHKYLFVDAYASWCGPCRQLKELSFKDPDAAEFYNRNFVNLSIDMEKGEGKSLALKWNIEEYPTLLIIDTEGKIIFRSVGYLNAKELCAFGKPALRPHKTNIPFN
ncbi:thioredoxin family protein [Pedobacter sp. R-06]|uniref:thioredoxin family protein n=1 Tax=Pedobacter sp. R-06 TaxID=3404051 RepID=UPI003CF36A2A